MIIHNEKYTDLNIRDEIFDKIGKKSMIFQKLIKIFSE